VPLPRLDPHETTLVARKAGMRDVPAMAALINHWARQGAMLAKNRDTLYTSIREYHVLEAADGTIVATVALHVLWHDLAEVRSLAVHPDFKGMGLGKQMVLAVEREARDLGITRLFAWTLEAKFFEHCAYQQISLDELPPKVWREYHKAAMLKQLA
jgi:amino-acid N-acetyltransferase